MDRDSDLIDLEFDDQLDAVIEERLSGRPPRSSALDSSENITVRPPALAGDSGTRARVAQEAEPPASDRAASVPEFVPHNDAAPNSESSGGGVGLSWDYLRRQVQLPVSVRLRALVEVLGALTLLHTDVARVPTRRFHGALWYGNLLFRNDGSALLLKDQSVTPQPTVYAAPELRRRQNVDQQVDCYAIGVMLLEALADQPLSSTEVNDLSLGDLGAHPFWGRLAGDPLLWVAVRATAREPARRWPTAREFADALTECAFDRISTREALGHVICAALFEQGDRATPLVAAPVSSRSPLSPPMSPLEASRARAPEAPQLAPLLSPLHARGLVANPVALEPSESAGPSVRPSERSTTVVSIPGDGDSGFGIAVSVAAARVPSFAAEAPADVLVAPKRRRARWLWAMAAVLMGGAGAFVLKHPPLPLTPTLAAERPATPIEALTPSHAAVHTTTGSAPNADAPNSKEKQSTPAASAVTHPSAASKRAASTDGRAAATPPVSVPAKPDATPLAAPRSAEGRKADADKPRQSRGASRYEPDGI